MHYHFVRFANSITLSVKAADYVKNVTIAKRKREKLMSKYECGYCGWEGTPEWFWYHAGKNYCSLHLKGRDTPDE